MNIFIYDSFLNHKKYDRLLAQIETRITDLGLNGKIIRLGLMKMVNDTVKNELKRGAKTIVAVGNNKTINQVINSLAGSPAPLGIIPIGEENNNLARSLGIESPGAACDILSARLLARLDLGRANKTYFLGSAAIENQGTMINMSSDFTVETAGKGLVQIMNLADRNIKLPLNTKIMPNDGVLELIINSQGHQTIFSKQADQSIFKIKKAAIINRSAQLILDGSINLPAPAEITVANQCLNVIVGKRRNF